MFRIVWYTKIQNFWTSVTLTAVIADVAVACMPCRVFGLCTSEQLHLSSLLILVKEEPI